MVSSLETLFGSAKALASSERELQKMLGDRGILFGDGLLPTCAFALLKPRERIDEWAARAERLVAAGEQQCRTLVADPGFLASVGLDPEAIELVRVDPGYQRHCVLCRPDGIVAGDDVKFVELNSDSPAMMMFLDIVSRCLLELDAFAPLRDQLAPSSAADRLLDALLACNREAGGTATPNIAITDWEGQKTRYEHQRLAEHFEARGYPTVVCDPHAFRTVDGKLHVKDRRIDLVYRRALVSEVLARRTEISPLIKAYRDHTICMVNPLRSYVAGFKAVMGTIGETSDYVPRTIVLDTEDARRMVADSPSRWALKKSESHGGQNVVLPGVANAAAWHAALAAAATDVWIAQEYMEVPQLSVPMVDGDAIVWTPRYFNWNPFVFDGRYAGGLVRFSSTPLINVTLGGGLMPTFTT